MVIQCGNPIWISSFGETETTYKECFKILCHAKIVRVLASSIYSTFCMLYVIHAGVAGVLMLVHWY